MSAVRTASCRLDWGTGSLPRLPLAMGSENHCTIAGFSGVIIWGGSNEAQFYWLTSWREKGGEPPEPDATFTPADALLTLEAPVEPGEQPRQISVRARLFPPRHGGWQRPAVADSGSCQSRITPWSRIAARR